MIEESMAKMSKFVFKSETNNKKTEFENKIKAYRRGRILHRIIDLYHTFYIMVNIIFVPEIYDLHLLFHLWYILVPYL